MKISIKLIATLLLLVASNAAFSAEPPSKKNVQVLPATEGVLKILYYNPSERNVSVKIFDEDGLLFQDHLRMGKGENGFMKRYKVEDNQSNILWVEIGDDDITYRFKIIQLNDGKMWATYWDNYPSTINVIAAK